MSYTGSCSCTLWFIQYFVEVCAKTNKQKTTLTFLKLDELHLWNTNMFHYKTKRLQYQKYYFSFGGKNGDTLVSLWYAKFMKAVATCAVLEYETLPPTERQCISTQYEYTFKFASGNILIFTA